MTRSTISVVIPAYNASATIARAIRSALAEPEVGAVVVVDDCSADDTAGAARAADDGSGRLSVQRMAVNAGPSAARNLALAQNDLPLLALLDSDDYLLPGRFARMLAAAHPDTWDFLADNILFTRSQSELAPDVVAEATAGPARARTLDLGAFVAGNISGMLRQRAELGFIKPVFRRETITRLNLSYQPQLRLGEDYILYCQALMRGARFALLSSCGYVAVEREGSLSGAHRTRDLETLLAADRGLVEEARTRGIPAADVALLRRHLANLGTKVDVRHAIEMAHVRGRYRTLAALSRSPVRLGRIAWRVIGDRLGGTATDAGKGVRKLLVDDHFA